ncbi:hypothetical protein [Martelella endophytica]|uniref:hypothetical protein n=1 Tax=Martelella endophytica TaxID=1486262 RepID=UPI00130D5D4E|nr:hypothetical protein [Martelella endophytica]
MAGLPHAEKNAGRMSGFSVAMPIFGFVLQAESRHKETKTEESDGQASFLLRHDECR